MAQAGNNYTYISTATTTVIGPVASTLALPTAGRRINLQGIAVNKTLTGTVTIKAGATTIGILAIGTIAGVYWFTNDGVEITDMQVITSAGDDVTILWNNV